MKKIFYTCQSCKVWRKMEKVGALEYTCVCGGSMSPSNPRKKVANKITVAAPQPKSPLRKPRVGGKKSTGKKHRVKR